MYSPGWAGLLEVMTSPLAACKAAAETLGFEPQVTFKGPVDTVVPVPMAEQLLPTLREALSNAVRHAGASAVTVTVAVDGEDVLLVVADNGKGLPENGRRSGLANMEQRATDLGGRFTATNGVGGGAEIAWRVPLRR